LAQHPLDLLDPRFGEGDGALLFVLLVIAAVERRDELIDPDIQLGIVLGRAGDDQRSARLVDQDRIDLVDDRKSKTRSSLNVCSSRSSLS